MTTVDDTMTLESDALRDTKDAIHAALLLPPPLRNGVVDKLIAASRHLVGEHERCTPDIEIKGRQLFAALAHIFLDPEIGDRARELTAGFPSPKEFRTPTAEALAEALCKAMPHDGGGSRLVYEDALEASRAALEAAR